MTTTYEVLTKNYSTGESVTETMQATEFLALHDKWQTNGGTAPNTVVTVKFTHEGRLVYLGTFASVGTWGDFK